MPVQNAYVLARLIPNAKLVTLRGAGHVFPLEQEEQTARALMEQIPRSGPGDQAGLSRPSAFWLSAIDSQRGSHPESHEVPATV